MSKIIEKRIPVRNTNFNKRTLDDRVYGWFQENSHAKNIDGKDITLSPKYILENKQPWLTLYRDLEPIKAKRKFKDQLKRWTKLGFIDDYEIIEEDGYKKEYYKLPYDKEAKEFYYLIDTNILDYLVNTKSSGAIKIYTYLMFKYAKFPTHTFTVKTLAQDCFNVKNVCKDKTGLSIMIHDCLSDLESNGFFSVDNEKYISLNGKATKVKQLYNINNKPFVIERRKQIIKEQLEENKRDLQEEFNKLSPEKQSELLFGH